MVILLSATFTIFKNIFPGKGHNSQLFTETAHGVKGAQAGDRARVKSYPYLHFQERWALSRWRWGSGTSAPRRRSPGCWRLQNRGGWRGWRETDLRGSSLLNILEPVFLLNLPSTLSAPLSMNSLIWEPEAHFSTEVVCSFFSSATLAAWSLASWLSRGL